MISKKNRFKIDTSSSSSDEPNDTSLWFEPLLKIYKEFMQKADSKFIQINDEKSKFEKLYNIQSFCKNGELVQFIPSIEGESNCFENYLSNSNNNHSTVSREYLEQTINFQTEKIKAKIEWINSMLHQEFTSNVEQNIPGLPKKMLINSKIVFQKRIKIKKDFWLNQFKLELQTDYLKKIQDCFRSTTIFSSLSISIIFKTIFDQEKEKILIQAKKLGKNLVDMTSCLSNLERDLSTENIPKFLQVETKSDMFKSKPNFIFSPIDRNIFYPGLCFGYENYSQLGINHFNAKSKQLFNEFSLKRLELLIEFQKQSIYEQKIYFKEAPVIFVKQLKFRFQQTYRGAETSLINQYPYFYFYCYNCIRFEIENCINF